MTTDTKEKATETNLDKKRKELAQAQQELKQMEANYYQLQGIVNYLIKEVRDIELSKTDDADND